MALCQLFIYRDRLHLILEPLLKHFPDDGWGTYPTPLLLVGSIM